MREPNHNTHMQLFFEARSSVFMARHSHSSMLPVHSKAVAHMVIRIKLNNTG